MEKHCSCIDFTIWFCSNYLSSHFQYMSNFIFSQFFFLLPTWLALGCCVAMATGDGEWETYSLFVYVCVWWWGGDRRVCAWWGTLLWRQTNWRERCMALFFCFLLFFLLLRGFTATCAFSVRFGLQQHKQDLINIFPNWVVRRRSSWVYWEFSHLSGSLQHEQSR